MAYVCERCSKCLLSKHGFANHIKNCKGIHPLECIYCNQIFQSRQSKYQHSLRCQLRPQQIQTCESKQNDAKLINTNNTTNNITTNNNNHQCTTNNHCNITNNNNTYIITLEQKPNKETNFETEEITSDKFLECLYDARSQKQYHLDVLSDFCDMVFSIPRNRCVKKDNLRTNYSKIHLGNNNWKVVADRNLYEKLLIDITKTFMKKLDEFDDIKDLNTKYKKLIWDVRGKTDHLSYGSYDEEEKELKNEHQIAKDNVKYAVHNNSK